MKQAILNADIEKVGLVAQDNALGMHEQNRLSNQPFDYFTHETRHVIDFVNQAYQSGLLAFVTIDAGPNVKIITDHATEKVLLAKLQAEFPELTFDIARAGALMNISEKKMSIKVPGKLFCGRIFGHKRRKPRPYHNN